MDRVVLGLPMIRRSRWPSEVRSGGFRIVVALCAVMISVQSGRCATPTYRLLPLGLADPLHQDNEGRPSSEVAEFGQLGYVMGQSALFDGFSRRQGNSSWQYDPSSATVTRLGLLDDEYLNENGQPENFATDMNRDGVVVGYRQRGSTSASDPWLFLPDRGQTQLITLREVEATTGTPFLITDGGVAFGSSSEKLWAYDLRTDSDIPIGLTDFDHRSGSGRTKNVIGEINARGQAAGLATRFLGGSEAKGKSAWFFDVARGLSTPIGLLDAEHVSSDLRRESSVDGMNRSGQVIGTTKRWLATRDSLGSSAWIYDAATDRTRRLGLTDEEHVDEVRRIQKSRPILLNEAGQVVGQSQRYTAAGVEAGYTLWIYDGSLDRTQAIGLMDPPHTQLGTGERYAQATGLNQQGQAVGFARRYDLERGDPEGVSTWFFDPRSGVTQEIGLTDPLHTQGDGTQENSISWLTDEGYVVGQATRFAAVTERGKSTWQFDPESGQTTRIGLFDDEHTDRLGRQLTEPIQSNRFGQTVGKSYRYAGDSQNGTSVWLFDPDSNQTNQLGLVDESHTGEAGYRVSSIFDLNDNGDVIGYSEQYFDSGIGGLTAWFYDSAADKTTPLVFSENSLGRSVTELHFMTDEGAVVGSFVQYDETGTGQYLAFAWSAEDGFRNLTEAVVGDEIETDWDRLIRATSMDSLGQILGIGALSDGTQMPFVLRPNVPGDFNGDLSLDADDIDQLSAAVRAGENAELYDLNGDGFVNVDDRQAWVEQLANTYFGDSNLDGKFDSQDLVKVFQAGEYEDRLIMSSTWTTGDWNGDREFDSADLVFVFQRAGYEVGPRQFGVMVPEPSTSAILLLLPLLMALRNPPFKAACGKWLVMLMFAATCGTSSAKEYEITPVVTTGVDVFFIGQQAPWINNRGSILFQAEPSREEDVKAMLLYREGELTQVVSGRPSAPRVPGQLNDFDEIVYSTSSPNDAFYWNEGRTRRLFVPEGPRGQFRYTYGRSPVINNRGQIAFTGTGQRVPGGVYRGDRSGSVPLDVLAGCGGDTYQGLCDFRQPTILPDGTVMALANRDGQDDQTGLYKFTGDGKFEVVVETGLDFQTITQTSVNSRGDVALLGKNVDGVEGIYLQAGNGWTTLAEDSFELDVLNPPGLNDRGDFIFRGRDLRTRQYALFTGPDVKQDRLIGTGDFLFDIPVTNVFAGPGSINNRGQIAFFMERQYPPLDFWEQGIFLASPVIVGGDISSSGRLDIEDIDMLTQEVRQGTNYVAYDLNGDDRVDAADRQNWVETIANTYFGDANLDGQFDSKDLIQVFVAGEYEDQIATDSTWRTGDWNGDGEFGSEDLVLALTSPAYERGPRTAGFRPVPEPASWVILIISLAFGFRLGLLPRRLSHESGQGRLR